VKSKFSSLCTGYSSQVAEEKAKGIGVREVVMKPLTAATLAQTVREVLDRRGA
jgi:hypothetical protein